MCVCMRVYVCVRVYIVFKRSFTFVSFPYFYILHVSEKYKFDCFRFKTKFMEKVILNFVRIILLGKQCVSFLGFFFSWILPLRRQERAEIEQGTKMHYFKTSDLARGFVIFNEGKFCFYARKMVVTWVCQINSIFVVRLFQILFFFHDLWHLGWLVYESIYIYIYIVFQPAKHQNYANKTNFVLAFWDARCSWETYILWCVVYLTSRE